MAYDGRRRLLSAGSLYVDVDKDLRDIANDIDKDDNYEELEWSLKPLRAEFKTKDTEILFKKYQSRLQHRFFSVLLMLNIIVNFLDSFWYFLSKTDNHFPFPALLRISSLIVYISFLILTNHNEKWLRSKLARSIAAITVLMAMLYAEYGGFLFTVTGDKLTFKWKRSRPVYYLIICNEILLPFPSRIYSSIASLVIVILEVIVTIVWAVGKLSDSSCRQLTPHNKDFKDMKEFYDEYRYLFSDLLFYIFAAMVAHYVTYLLEIVNRRAFLDHRRCVESKFKLNFEKDQQEQLLGSCLPKHLMRKVRSDIRDRFNQHFESSLNQNSFSRPFTELYIEKFKDVTILYADIVNSMLLTQSLESPQALVETLNGLFGRFDSRAEANNCLRIKLLGDCYYCVSGIPEYDPKHALNSIYMGIDMIDIIRTLREENQVNVDMRIGVHTGMVLSGLLGLKKWQYDIWSIDSMKASQMEHDGKPGYVHVTKTTLDLVSKEMRQNFHIQENRVIPGETTYLIRKSRHHLTNGKHYVKQVSKTEPKNIEKFHYPSTARNSSLSSRSSRIGSIHFSRRRTVLEVGLGKYREMLNFANDTLSKAIDKMPLNIKRQYNASHHSIEINPYFLHFIPKKTPKTLSVSQLRHIHTLDIEKERLFIKEDDPLFPFYLYCSTVICIAIMVIRFLTLFDEPKDIIIFWYSEGSIVCYVTIAIIAFSLFLIKFMKQQPNYLHRILIWLAISSSFILMTTLDMIHCPISSNPETQEQIIEKFDEGSREHECLYKWSRYYTYSCVLSLTSINMFIRINLWLKFILSTFSLLVINFLTQHHSCSVFLRVDHFYESQNNTELEFYTPRMAHMQYLFIVYLMFYVIDRQIEYISRLDFLWSTKLKQERREAQLTREVNQLLLKNILPIHVAQRYLFNSQDPAEQLYYEAYNSCAVMFAAIPNFFKYYTESDINGDGLQYLRILNEIICEFDRLLMLPQFRSKIEKIKTIGSTYMAASGLQPGRGSIDSVISTEEEVENLIVLIRFAMAMMKSLERVNNQANQWGANQHMNFKLRVGISMGPVIAGVVGAVKPQYDIWGDTVNVASRMDTNGISNKIHVTEEVANILQELNLFKPVCRGVMEIKGKGKLTTFLIDCDMDMTEELFGLI